MLWEIQTLTRSRPIAGDMKVGARFQEMAGRLTDFSQPSQPLAAYAPDWKARIHQMRMRIEKERTARGQEDLAIKTGAGGLMDAEFVAQTLCLDQGWQEPNTLRALERGGKQGVLPDAEKLIENYWQLRRVEGILRRWSYEGESALPARSRAVLPGIGALRVRFTGAIWRGFTRLPASHPRGLCQGVFDRTSSG